MKQGKIWALAVVCGLACTASVSGADQRAAPSREGNEANVVARGGDRGGGGDFGRDNALRNDEGYGGYGGGYGGYYEPFILPNNDPFPDEQQSNDLYNSYKKLPE